MAKKTEPETKTVIPARTPQAKVIQERAAVPAAVKPVKEPVEASCTRTIDANDKTHEESRAGQVMAAAAIRQNEF